MKKRYLIILLLLGSLTACSDWLDVTPSYDLEEEQAFSSVDGFNTALRGLYQKAATSSLYGKHLHWGFLSGVAQTYEDSWDNTIYKASLFDYEGNYTLGVVEGFWTGLYNIIANANLLIKNVEKADPSMFVLDTMDVNRIHGEALGMRAIMHLDILRLFAPAPSRTGGQEALVPYHDKFPSEFTVPKTTMETLDLIIGDLKKAADLLAPYDTINQRTVAFYSNWAPDSKWYAGNQRGWHFTYMAALCYLSRAYMYKGDYENALFYANYWYKRFSVGKTWPNKYYLFPFSTGYGAGQSSSSYKAYKAMTEVVFAVYQGDLLEWTGADYIKSTYGRGLCLGKSVYDIFGVDLDDIRLEQLELREMEDTYYGGTFEEVYSKRYDETTASIYERQALPMIRLSEMYYNMIECNYRLGKESEALRLLTEFRKGKKMSLSIDVINSLYDLQDIIINDARRDWLTEGQLFFLYKRMNRGFVHPEGYEIPLTDKNTTFTIPDSQNI